MGKKRQQVVKLEQSFSGLNLMPSCPNNDRSKHEYRAHSMSGPVLNAYYKLTHLTLQCPTEADPLVNTTFYLNEKIKAQ